VIETWDLPEDPIGHVVGFSNADTVRGMVDHFVARGLTRIAFIGGDTSRDTRGADRRAGFLAAMRAHGLDAVAPDRRRSAADLDARGGRGDGAASRHAARHRGGDLRVRPVGLRRADRMPAARRRGARAALDRGLRRLRDRGDLRARR
jgi:hypothetical protein